MQPVLAGRELQVIAPPTLTLPLIHITAICTWRGSGSSQEQFFPFLPLRESVHLPAVQTWKAGIEQAARPLLLSAKTNSQKCSYYNTGTSIAHSFKLRRSEHLLGARCVSLAVLSLLKSDLDFSSRQPSYFQEAAKECCPKKYFLCLHCSVFSGLLFLFWMKMTTMISCM